MSSEATSDRPRPSWSALALGLVLVAAGVAGLVELAYDPFLSDIDAGDADPGPAFFPRILLYLLIAGGVGQTVSAAIQASRSGGFAADSEFSISRLAVPVALAASVFVYAKALPLVGYLAATVAFALAWLWIVGTIDRSLPRKFPAAAGLVLLEAAVISLLLYAVFGYGISVPLP
ncbi:MAG: tripartite tricarboxylate transporter TctB family protein [Pseudorhodoplanes sp.]